jgi:hypothetical protein
MSAKGSRPVVSEAAEENAADELSADNLPTDTDTIPQQLRRRREAAKRLPPLSNGVRDPWDLQAYYEPARGA